MIKAATHLSKEQRLSLRQVLQDLIEDGLVTPAQARDLISRPGTRDAEDRHPLVLVSECEWLHAGEPARKLSLEYLVQWLARRTGLPYHRIDPLTIDVPRITAVTPYAYAARVGILPIKVTQTEITVATAQPFLLEWERELRQVTKKDITRVIANPRDIERYQVEFYALARSVKASSEERRGTVSSGVQNLEQLMELGRKGELDAKSHHVINIVDWLMQYAFDQRASDIHMEPRREQGNVRFRIDGVLHDVYQLPSPVMAAVTSRIKIVSRMDLAEKRRPQDGRIKTRNPEGREVELRVSSLPTAFGEKMVLRIFDPEVLVRDFAQLGFPPDEAARWQQMIEQPHGIILVTGPTGSGKTTTLYSTLKQLATSEVNVCSIEDPIELVEPAFNQMQVQPAIDLHFADGVRALMRQDPDIIMVGEIRDLETAEVAIQAALTGHLVLSTLHTNDAPAAITRLLDLGAPPYLIKATLLGVVAQRLVRRLCPHCKQNIEPSDKLWQELMAGWNLAKPTQICEPVGCLECRATGYLGRVGVYEMMSLSPPVRTHINEKTDLAHLREAALRDGMTPLRIAGAHKVIAGLTSVDEVMKTTPAPTAIK
jgi:general secretion pathway protein E